MPEPLFTLYTNFLMGKQYTNHFAAQTPTSCAACAIKFIFKKCSDSNPLSPNENPIITALG